MSQENMPAGDEVQRMQALLTKVLQELQECADENVARTEENMALGMRERQLELKVIQLMRENAAVHDENRALRSGLENTYFALAMALGESCIPGDTRLYIQQSHDLVERTLGIVNWDKKP